MLRWWSIADVASYCRVRYGPIASTCVGSTVGGGGGRGKRLLVPFGAVGGGRGEE